MDETLRLVYMDVRELKENPSNWRIHPQSQARALRDVIADVGWAGALLYNETTKRLIDGHLRKKVSKGKVPVLVGSWTEEQEKKILATLDPLSAMAQPDQDKLLALLEDVKFESQAVNDILEALANSETQPMPYPSQDEMDSSALDRAEELQKIWGTASGQTWAIGPHRLYCGNNRQTESFIASAKPDILLTDPPYGINIVRGINSIGGARLVGRVTQPGGRKWLTPRLYKQIEGDSEPFDPQCWLSIAKTVILFGANHYASRLPDSPSWLVWDKGISEDATFSACELIWTNQGGHVKKYEWLWSGMVCRGDRAIEMQDRVHPTQKPVGLLELILADFATPGQRLLDPYLGSGSTMVAAHRQGLICYGIEVDMEYCAVTLQRMAELGQEPRLL